MTIVLKIPDEHDKERIEKFRDDFMRTSETLHIPGASTLAELSYTEWLANIRQDATLPGKGRVKASQFIALDEAGIVVGVIQLREALTPWLEQFAGHIGYAVHPNYRKKGYASDMLSQVLKRAHIIGLKEVLVTCDSNNIASEKTILRQGGKYENSITNDLGQTKKRFWISVENSLDSTNK